MKRSNFGAEVKEFIVVFLVMLTSTMSVVYSMAWMWHAWVFVTFLSTILVTGFVVRKCYLEKITFDWRNLLRKYWYFLPYIIYSLVSILWSNHIDISIYRWGILICTFFLGWYFSQKYSLRKFESYILLFSVYVVIMTVVITILDEINGVSSYDPLMRYFWHRNHTGLYYSLVACLSLINVIRHRQERKFRYYGSIGLYVVSILAIIMTKSVSSIFTTLILHGLIVLMIFWLTYKSVFKSWHYIAIAILFFLLLLLAAGNLDFIFGVFGRKANLTGRVPMWTNLLNLYFRQHPFFGYGFNAFWYQPSHRLVVGTISDLPPVGIADNGFIDILISGGLVGFMLFLIFYVALWVEPIRAVIHAKKLYDCVPFLVMVMIFLGNLTWSMLYENESFYMLVMLTMHFLLTRNKDEKYQFNKH